MIFAKPPIIVAPSLQEVARIIALIGPLQIQNLRWGTAGVVLKCLHLPTNIESIESDQS